ncbi:MAG TPA: divalent-cation tolerance protein CutA [Actinomycetota bacterium]
MGVSEPAALQVFCTVDSEGAARDLASALVEASLAACVQVVGPVHSTYRWRGAVETATEWLLLMKTTEGRFARLRDAIVNRHPYEVPEIVAVPITAGLPAYLDWIDASTS